MNATCYLLILLLAFCFCKQIVLANRSEKYKRSIVDAQDVSLFQLQSFCDVYKDFTPRQREICHEQMHLMGSVADGASLAKKECARQFKYERWNCSIAEKSTMLGRMTKVANKEAAFNYALVAAGIVHVMARDCMKGKLDSCHCSRAKRPKSLLKEHKWGGCGDNIAYAMDFARNFLADDRIKKLNGKSEAKLATKLLVDAHNNYAGMLAIIKNREIICKCHGVTGNCAYRTCWYQVKDFNHIGDYLKEKYSRAHKVKLVRRRQGRKVALKAKYMHKLFSNKHELVYAEDSPSYCNKKGRAYSLGTIGRECNATTTTTTSPGSCFMLCCGRGFSSLRKVVSEKCDCAFMWCCEVRCRTCKRVVEVHTCR